MSAYSDLTRRERDKVDLIAIPGSWLVGALCGLVFFLFMYNVLYSPAWQGEMATAKSHWPYRTGHITQLEGRPLFTVSGERQQALIQVKDFYGDEVTLQRTIEGFPKVGDAIKARTSKRGAFYVFRAAHQGQFPWAVQPDGVAGLWLFLTIIGILFLPIASGFLACAGLREYVASRPSYKGRLGTA